MDAHSLLSAWANGRPTAAMLEVADRCNETCVHCYQVQGQKGEMSTAELKRVIDELAQMGVLFLTFSGGEATLRRDLIELMRYARERGFVLKLFTNGLRISDALVEALASLAVQQVEISLYARRPELHDWVTGVDDSFHRTVDSIKRLRAAEVPVVVKTPIMNVNESEIADFRAFVEGLGAQCRFDAALSPREGGDRAPEALAASPGAGTELWLEKPTSPDEVSAVPLEAKPCGACQAVVHVEPNGEVRPCTQIAESVGHALEDGVASAWASEAAEQFRGLTWRDLPACRACDLRGCCSRCYETARVHAGNALLPYSQACEVALRRYRSLYPRVYGDAESHMDRIGDDLVDAQGRVLGPFVETSPGCLMRGTFDFEEADRARVEAMPWLTRQDTDAGPKLVQLRRPGRLPVLSAPEAAAVKAARATPPRAKRGAGDDGDALGRRIDGEILVESRP